MTVAGSFSGDSAISYVFAGFFFVDDVMFAHNWSRDAWLVGRMLIVTNDAAEPWAKSYTVALFLALCRRIQAHTAI